MKFEELPQHWQDELNRQMSELHKKNTSGPYRVCLYNKEGTRYIYASRVCHEWHDNRGNYMPFGGGTHWTISYGAVQFRATRNCMGEVEYELCHGKTYNASQNGTKIPSFVQTKKEVMDIIEKVGIF